jgi:signal transduction histidine kinase
MGASTELHEKSIEVVKHIDRKPVTVEMDKDHLQQVLQNLLKNACQAMSAGGRLTISTSSTACSAHAPGEFAEIKISDTGSGITEEDIGRIFEPFFTTKRDGMGLGLYISRLLVARYHGEMIVQTCKGKGTTFVVRLPLKLKEREIGKDAQYC